MKMDRGGRTLEDYRQLYWDGQKRIAELESREPLCRCADEVCCDYLKRIAELEETNRAYKEAWSVNIFTNRIEQLEATIKAIRELKPRIVYLDPDRLEIIEVIMFDDLVAALEQTNEQ